MHSSETAAIPIHVQVTGVDTADIADYAADRVASAVQHAHAPILYAKVHITRHHDPAVERPVIAQANLDVNGRLVRAQVSAETATEAIDLLHDRLRQRLQHYLRRSAGHWEDRRGRRWTGDPHEWRHGNDRAHRDPYFPRPAEDRQIIRHKSYTVTECGPDDAAFDMEAMDHDFHLFTELGSGQDSGQDSVLYRGGPDGYRLAQVEPHPEMLSRHALPITLGEQPAPVLSTDEAVQRMAAMGHPFLFFLDGERGRGAVLYQRYDGHYGLITPAG